MGAARDRRIEAREHRQESLRNRGITVEKTVQLPPPKNFDKESIKTIKKEIVKTNKFPVVTEVVKRGRGRPPKAISDLNKKNKKDLVVKKNTKAKEKR
jgi:hypothetical protein